MNLYQKKTGEGIVITTKFAEYTVCIAHEEIKQIFLCNNKKAEIPMLIIFFVFFKILTPYSYYKTIFSLFLISLTL
jgi:hypothetical protein